jgi:arabinan endo-1,5-alpha-L-arabinosidase
MLINVVRSRHILLPILVAATGLLGLSGCNSGNTSSASVAPTSVALSSNVTSVNLGGSVTLTASLGFSSGGTAPIGVITFFDGTNSLQATSIASGTTLSTTQTLTAGVHTITAAYAGDQTHAASTSNPITITVYAGTTTTLTASPTLASNAAPVTLTATVAAAVAGVPPPTGSVIFYAGTTALGTASLSTVSGSQVATLVTNALTTTGFSSTNYSITASYVASSYFLASTSSAVTVTIHPTLIVTSTALTLSSPGTVSSGTSETLSATVTGVSAGAASPSGTITFYDTNTTVTPNTVITLGSATVTAGSSTTASASVTTKEFNVGSNNSITAVYSGDAAYATSTSPAASLTLSTYTGSTYTNPLTLTDTVNNTGAVYNCPDPAIIKSQTSGVDTWYAYCTGDAFNNSDSATVNGPLRTHLISIFSSSDLVHWSYVHDAFAALPAWAATGTELYEPAIKLIGGTYMLYFRGNTNNANSAVGGSGEAIGVGTASTPAGPFAYTSTTTPLVPSTAACGGGCSATTLAPEVVYDGTNYWISYGGVYGGLYIQKLNAAGTATSGSATSIAIDNFYTNPYILSYNGYYYLFATPSGSCCNGAYSTYSVRVGRSKSITGPYLDAEGNDMNASNPSNGQTQGEPGGDTVLVNTGNTIWGPGSNTVFADEAGQYYALYSGISANRQCLTSGGTYLAGSCYAARQLMMDPIDWVNGWPVVRGGMGDSDQAQPVPASQPNATNGYVTPVYTPDAPGTLMASYSQDFPGATAFNSEFAFIHQNPNTTCQSDGSGVGSTFPYGPIAGDNPGFSSSGYTLCSNFAASDSSYPGDTMAQLPILAETEPTGNYMIEVKFHSLVPPTACCSANYSSQGLLVYSNDNTYLRLDEAANFDTRQIEYLNQLTSLSTVFYAPGGTPNGANYTYLRLAKRITNTTTGAATYTSYSSVDGVNYVRGPAWDVSYGTSGTKVGIFAGNTGFGAIFSYIHVSTLTP